MSGLVRGQEIPVATGRERQTTVTYQGPGRCRRGRIGCGEAFLWCLTRKGKRMPVNLVPDEKGIYTAHWATCPAAAAFR